LEVPLLNLGVQLRALQDDVMEAVARVLKTQQFILGPEVRGLEEEISAFLGGVHAVGVASGTDALVLALKALGVGRGDRVVTTPFSFVATAEAISLLGGIPVFADIDPVTFNLDPQRVDEILRDVAGPKPRAVIPVHLYGRACDLDGLEAVARVHGLGIVEDAAQAFGGYHGGLHGRPRALGTVGHLGCFSFYPTKNLGGAGEGGMVVTRHEAAAGRVRSLRVHGSASDPYCHEEVGFNSRLDALQAAILRVKLPHVAGWNRARIQRALRYDRLMGEADLAVYGVRGPGGGRPAPDDPHPGHVFHQYVVRVAERRDELARHLLARGVGSRVYYPIPIHLQPCYRELGYGEGAFPHAERAAREVLALPMFPELLPEEQEYVISSIRDFYRA
jgi:dTDP-4-amino-4,6-dideoxygalactose transaminase